MSDYYNRNNKKKRRSRREKIGFYTAFSICLIAVAMAVYSTYNTLSDENMLSTETTAGQVEQVDNDVTGVIETKGENSIDLTVPTIAATEAAEYKTDETVSDDGESKTALETMLSADVTLSYPLSSNNILREYSEDSVYYKILNVWKPHTGVDFIGALGDDVYAMTGGAVTKVYEDEMYGKTVEISTNNIVCIYSGLESVAVEEGDSVDTGSKIGVVGAVPCEASDADHIHVSVKVDGEYADPLSFVGNDE